MEGKWRKIEESSGKVRGKDVKDNGGKEKEEKQI